MKLCFRCMSRIPSLASRCPNCLDQHQNTWGRILLLMLAFAAAIWLADRYSDGRWPFQKPVAARR